MGVLRQAPPIDCPMLSGASTATRTVARSFMIRSSRHRDGSPAGQARSSSAAGSRTGGGDNQRCATVQRSLNHMADGKVGGSQARWPPARRPVPWHSESGWTTAAGRDHAPQDGPLPTRRIVGIDQALKTQLLGWRAEIITAHQPVPVVPLICGYIAKLFSYIAV